jgi:hypothetical protein
MFTVFIMNSILLHFLEQDMDFFFYRIVGGVLSSSCRSFSFLRVAESSSKLLEFEVEFTYNF